MNDLSLDDIQRAQQELLDEAHDYFNQFYDWEADALRQFTQSEGAE